MRRFLGCICVIAILCLPVPQLVRPAFGRTTVNGDEQSQTYVGSRKSNVYHRPTCQHARRIKPENPVSFKSKDEAAKAGYRPCKVCRP